MYCTCIWTFFHVLCIALYEDFSLLTPIQENGVKEEEEGQGEGAPDSSPQGQPDAVSPTPGLGEDDDDPSWRKERWT